jgi:hypothetical protein
MQPGFNCTTTYIHLAPDSIPPALRAVPSKFVVVVEAEVSCEWQKRVSDWIVTSGCLYMMAWGRECSTWDDSVDWANIDLYGTLPIPESQFVITTWHNDEPLAEVFWFAKRVAQHACFFLAKTGVLDISTASRQNELLHLYEAA